VPAATSVFVSQQAGCRKPAVRFENSVLNFVCHSSIFDLNDLKALYVMVVRASPPFKMSGMAV
jgi:hypothetical protein